MGPSYFDWLGRPITREEWARLFDDERHVGDDNVDGVDVSTVWLGLDHSFGLQGAPLIFETMIFGGEFDQWQWRWHTERDAREAHRQIVAALAAGLVPNPSLVKEGER